MRQVLYELSQLALPPIRSNCPDWWHDRPKRVVILGTRIHANYFYCNYYQRPTATTR
ncbi:MAG TPA: hypothetical protein V6D33_18565 [Cyanophyceae cyanobacterium]